MKANKNIIKDVNKVELYNQEIESLIAERDAKINSSLDGVIELLTNKYNQKIEKIIVKRDTHQGKVNNDILNKFELLINVLIDYKCEFILEGVNKESIMKSIEERKSIVSGTASTNNEAELKQEIARLNQRIDELMKAGANIKNKYNQLYYFAESKGIVGKDIRKGNKGTNNTATNGKREDKNTNTTAEGIANNNTIKGGNKVEEKQTKEPKAPVVLAAEDFDFIEKYNVELFRGISKAHLYRTGKLRFIASPLTREITFLTRDEVSKEYAEAVEKELISKFKFSEDRLCLSPLTYKTHNAYMARVQAAEGPGVYSGKDTYAGYVLLENDIALYTYKPNSGYSKVFVDSLRKKVQVALGKNESKKTILPGKEHARVCGIVKKLYEEYSKELACITPTQSDVEKELLSAKINTSEISENAKKIALTYKDKPEQLEKFKAACSKKLFDEVQKYLSILSNESLDGETSNGSSSSHGGAEVKDNTVTGENKEKPKHKEEKDTDDLNSSSSYNGVESLGTFGMSDNLNYGDTTLL